MLAPDASPELVSRRMLRALGPGSGLVAETALQREQGMRAIARQGLSRLTQIATLVQLAAILAMTTAMGAMVWQRRTRLARFKVQGYGRGVLWRALICESCLLLGAGCAIGAAFGMYGQLLISHALATVTGFPIVFSAGIRVAIISSTLVGMAAVGMVALLGYGVVSLPPDAKAQRRARAALSAADRVVCD
jgi:putative ABC transport system permease protein